MKCSGCINSFVLVVHGFKIVTPNLYYLEMLTYFSQYISVLESAFVLTLVVSYDDTNISYVMCFITMVR